MATPKPRSRTPFRGCLGAAALLLATLGALMPLGTARAQAAGDAPAEHTNRLAHESSPYLLQHAHNPVDWYPWGEEAFAAARERGVPILLSVGYSTCYWCHVMERESFEDPAVAALMNEKFVCVKVDREERPDVDEIYMSALQALSRSGGGWPMNVVLTPPGARGPDDPGLEPFFAGTYFPPAQTPDGVNSWTQVVQGISDLWENRRGPALEQAAAVTNVVREHTSEVFAPTRIDTNDVGLALSTLLRVFDDQHGGYGGAPKFPQPVFTEFVIDVRAGIADPAISARADRAIRETLDAMAIGGICDQVGGGFHRYATDDAWAIPHFEKMLYDNAQLASLYARNYMRSRDPLDARTVRRTLDYVLREMTDASGLFYSAQDAEVDGHEGANYLWTRDEVVSALGSDDGAFAASVFGLDNPPNFRDPHHPEDPMRHVLALRARPDALATEIGPSPEAFGARLDAVCAKLLAVRNARPSPSTDDKVLTGWNGLMIGAMAEGGVALKEPRYLDAAERGAKALLALMRKDDGTLIRAARGGVASDTPAVLEDYAFLIKGLITLHRAGALSMRADPTYLDAARALTEVVFNRFGDPQTGTLYNTAEGERGLLVRARSCYDGATCCGQSVMIHNLLDLADITQDQGYRESAEAVLTAMSSDVSRSPIGAVNSTRALLRILRVNPGFADRLGPSTTPPPTTPDDAVQIMAQTDRVQVPEGKVVELPIRIEIDPKFHINAHNPNVSGLIGLSATIDGSDAVTVDADWPAGSPMRSGTVPKGEGPLLVHRGVVQLTLKLRRTGSPWNPGDRPIIHLTYQVCTDTECLAPRTVELDVAIDP